MSKFWSKDEENQLRELAKDGLSYKEIAQVIGRSKLSIEKKAQNLNISIGNKEFFEKTESQDSIVITSKSSTIRTLEDALKHAKVDTKIWEVERHSINKWDVVSKVSSETVDHKKWTNKLAATELWQVKIWLKRKIPKLIEEGIKEFLKQIPAQKPQKYDYNHGSCLFEMSIFDHHFGKLAWQQETNNSYNLKIAEQIYSEAAHQLIERSRSFSIEKIIVPIGQDFFHVDGPLNTTTAGTFQDTDGRLAKIFATGQRALINMIDLLMGIAPVHLIYCPGNHDQYTSWYLIKTLEAWYRNNKHVTIDAAPTSRKCVEYGVNLIGYTHGNEEKHSSLPAIMAGQWPEIWGRTKYREWHLGHYHKIAETHYNAAETIDGVLIRILPSLSGTDSWHYKKGFIGGLRAAQAFIYHRKDGYIGHFNANIRTAKNEDP